METGAGAPEQAAMIRPHKANTAAARALPCRHDLLSTISPPGSSPDEQEGHSRTKRLNPHRRVRYPAAVRPGLSDLASIISQPRESASRAAPGLPAHRHFYSTLPVNASRREHRV